MNENKSFWAWFIRGIRAPLRDLYDRVYEYWYGILICSGPMVTWMSLLSVWMNYHPTWVSTDYITTGSFGYYADPKIMPWMIFWPATGIVMFMLGLYGYWRKKVK